MRSLRAILLAIFCLAGVWTLWLAAFGGFAVSLLGLRLRSNTPWRAALVALTALAGYRLAGGVIRVSPALVRLRRLSSVVTQHPGWVAALVAALSTALAIAGSTRIAGGSDAYGYVSQADLWIAGDLTTDQPWVAEVPWPDAKWTFSPLGYRPREWDRAIAPTYSPGVPMLMAAAKLAAGQCAMFLVGPLLGGLAVLATYGLGVRVGSPWPGVAAAWLLATSPIVAGSMEPLSDVPVMSAWTLAFYFVLGSGVRPALTAGAFAALAILIRPNLVPLAAPLGLWFLIRRGPAMGERRERVICAAAYGVAVLAGVAAVAAINQHLFGSPASSGYGRLEDQFALARVIPNLQRYLAWFVESQTPLALLGFVALFVPLRAFWPHLPDRRIFVVVGLFIAVLWGEYLAYLEFDSWGYLRFVLPGWPWIMLGLAAALAAIGRTTGAFWLTAAVVLALGAWNLHVAERSAAFDQRQAARHEAPVGRLVRAHTPENSVVLAMQRSGSLRYYAGRITLRYDMLDRAWLDRAVAWMTERGIHVYAMLDEREVAEVRERFAGQRTLRALDRAVLIYQPAGTSLYDLSSPDAGRSPDVIRNPLPDLDGCDPPVGLAPLRP